MSESVLSILDEALQTLSGDPGSSPPRPEYEKPSLEEFKAEQTLLPRIQQLEAVQALHRKAINLLSQDFAKWSASRSESLEMFREQLNKIQALVSPSMEQRQPEVRED
jgi:hypothetical protein